VKGYEALAGKPFEPMDVYMGKIMDSLMVFNTPAVKKCHGWKLPEFLAWGKAIITTPMWRMLPAPMVDGEDVIVTDGSIGDLSEKVQAVMSDPILRKRLEQNARKYYDTYLTPERVISRILEKVECRF
jgi:glycosyltransferase involved in cell wall biosynthesis